MQQNQKWPISLVIITKNEESNIARAIQSVPFVDEVIVLDSESTDNTVSLAKGLGAKVFIEPFRGFRNQKERAMNLAKNDWILSLDADEVLSPRLQDEIQSLWLSQKMEDNAGIRFPRLSRYLDRWIWHGGWYPDYQLRFFKRSLATWTGGQVHERVLVKGSILTSKAPLEHYVFRDIAHQIQSNNLYSSYGAGDLLEKGTSFSIGKLLIKTLSKFIETYIFKKGFLDGFPGFIISVNAAHSIFLKFSKLWELQRDLEAESQASQKLGRQKS